MRQFNAAAKFKGYLLPHLWATVRYTRWHLGRWRGPTTPGASPRISGRGWSRPENHAWSWLAPGLQL